MTRAIVRPVALAVALSGLAAAPQARAQGCDSGTYWISWFGESEKCWSNSPWLKDVHTCALAQYYSCGTGAPTGEPFCTGDDGNGSGCAVAKRCCDYWPLWPECPEDHCDGTSIDQCTMLGGPEVCGDGIDNNYDGCIDENCTKGTGLCRCTASCNPLGTCTTPAVSTCNPYMAQAREICGNGVDDNCNGLVDEGCAPKEPNSCGGVAGKDPILLYTRSAVTEPFTDFSVETLGRLALTRTYSSADVSLYGGSPGIFGRGWHHDWEATLSCAGEYCTIARGLQAGFAFHRTGTAPSLDGTETWEIYGRGDTEVVRASDGNGILVRRPSGTWIYFAPDGSELHFASVCDCGGGDPTCLDPKQGGVARLVDSFDARGNGTHVTYDRSSGLLLGLSDALGHSLEVRGTGACYAPVATELRYDGALVATYLYSGGDLDRVVDPDGNVLRRYYYFAGGLLHAVVNEGGAAIAEFAYDTHGDAVSVIDGASDVSVTYSVDGSGHLLAQVTERYDQASAVSTRELDQDGHVVGVTGECSCGPRASTTWQGRNPQCFDDGNGMWTYTSYDAYGRLTYTATYPKSERSCPIVPSYPPSGDSQQEWYQYGIVKPIADGVSLPLSVRTATLRGTVFTDESIGETLDHDPSPKGTIDPAGYQCQAAPLPAGSVVCRRITSGFTYAYNGARNLERYATFHSYDARGRLVRSYGPVNLDAPAPDDVPPLEERTYWPDGESLARRGRVHEVKRYTLPSGPALVTTIDYDAFGPYSITDAMGVITLLVKDGRGRTQHVVSPGRHVETRFYDGTAPRLVLTAGGSVVRTSYDQRGRVNKIEHLDRDPEASGASPRVAWSEHTVYDAAGNAIHVERRDESGAIAWVQDRRYDVQHRVTSAAHPERPGAARTWEYDASGFLARISDEDQRRTAFAADAWRRVSAITQSGLDASGAPVSGKVAEYHYEPWRNALASVQDGKATSTAYEHDDFGRVSRLTSDSFKAVPGYPAGYWFRYDARGNLRERRATFQTVRYAYDGLDRLTSVVAQECGGTDSACTPTNTSVPWVAYQYTYDESGDAGKLTSISDLNRTVRFDYDAAGRLAAERVEEPGIAALVTSYAYDADGRVNRITYPSGLALQLDRDRATGEVRTLSKVDGTATFVDAAERWPGGPLRSFTFGSGETYSANMNRRYEPVTIRSGPLALDYTTSASGDVVAVVDGATTFRYGYDFRDRLVSRSPAAPTQDLVHQYPAGQWYPWGNLDRIIRSGTQSGSGFSIKYGYGYDRQGNLSSIGAWSNGSAYTGVCLRHDAMGRLAIVGPGPHNGPDELACYSDDQLTSVTARFAYDAQNRRIARWSAATNQWTYFVHGPGGELLSEVVRTGDAAHPWAPVRDYVWLDGRPVAQIEYQGASARTYAVHADHLGTPRMLTNPERAVVWSAAVQPYGEVTETTTPDPSTGRMVVTNLRLPGQYDERLFAAAGIGGMQGPYYNWNRWYLPGVGRYLEPDPWALRGGFNALFGPDWYGYANQNPLSYTDLNGELPGCPGCYDTYCCCVQKWGPEACGEPPVPAPKPNPVPRPPIPEPPPTNPTLPPRPPPPDVPPLKPGTGCKGMFDICMGACQGKCGNWASKSACAAGCTGLYIACLARGG